MTNPFIFAPTAITAFFATTTQRARTARQHAALRRDLARLPRYIRDDILDRIDETYIN